MLSLFNSRTLGECYYHIFRWISLLELCRRIFALPSSATFSRPAINFRSFVRTFPSVWRLVMGDSVAVEWSFTRWLSAPRATGNLRCQMERLNVKDSAVSRLEEGAEEVRKRLGWGRGLLLLLRQVFIPFCPLAWWKKQSKKRFEAWSLKTKNLMDSKWKCERK